MDHAFVVDRGKVISGCPVLGAVLGAPIDGVRLERLQRNRRVAKIFETQFVEIIAADIDVELFAPIVVHALVDDVAARRKILDPVGAGAQRRFERRGADVALVAVVGGALPPMLGQDQNLADDLRQLAIARRIEREDDVAFAGLFRLDDVAVIGGELRVVFLERVEREDGVFGRYRLAVVPFRFGAQPIGGRGEIVRIANGLGEEAVFAGHFVERRNQQRVVDKVDPGRERSFDAGDRDVEIVVGAECDLPRDAALRRLALT